MYATCLRCDHSLGTNIEVPHLKVGRKLAFDTTRGRLWVICPRCGQWNLTPLEERWEALAECEQIAADAEARSGGAALGLAQTTSELELLRVGGMSDADIANWRYGRRIAARQRRLLSALIPLAVLALALGIGAWRISGAPFIGAYTAMLAGSMRKLLPVFRGSLVVANGAASETAGTRRLRPRGVGVHGSMFSTAWSWSG
ncbi:MAG: hypothetical protein ACJ8AD_15810 [Gemmatimonadaceae bacterium]